MNHVASSSFHIIVWNIQQQDICHLMMIRDVCQCHVTLCFWHGLFSISDVLSSFAADRGTVEVLWFSFQIAGT